MRLALLLACSALVLESTPTPVRVSEFEEEDPDYYHTGELAEGGMRHGGLHREPDDLPVYRVLFENEAAPDWGSRGRYFQLAADCRACHSGSHRPECR